jgi:hypothetical protein
MRAQNDPRSEMVSQALFGETATVLGEVSQYSLIRTEDDYEGWALTEHLAELPFSQELKEYVVSGAFAPVLTSYDPYDIALTKLSMGSRVKVLETDHDFAHVVIPRAARLGAEVGYVATKYLKDPEIVEAPMWPFIHHCANQLVGTPYLWGGASAFGIDCSGFAQRIFGVAGIRLPRDAYQQALSPLGARTSESETPQYMDIVFFLGKEDPRQRGITHVGVARDSEYFYHASSRSGLVLSRFDDPLIRDEYRYLGGLRLFRGKTIA